MRVWRPLSKTSTANQRKKHNVQKVHSVPYNAFVDNTSIFICLADVASQICEIPWNYPKIQTYSSSRSSKLIDLGANGNCILLDINSNFGRISFRFYRAMHFSAKRGIAIACRLSVRLSVCLSVCNVGELWSHRLEFFEKNFIIS